MSTLQSFIECFYSGVSVLIAAYKKLESMADNSNKTSSESSSPRTPMGSPQSKLLHKFFCFSTCCRSNPTLRVRRRLRGDVEEEFQYASSDCLSSYYSVFVVRLAIMVCHNLPLCSFPMKLSCFNKVQSWLLLFLFLASFRLFWQFW